MCKKIREEVMDIIKKVFPEKTESDSVMNKVWIFLNRIPDGAEKLLVWEKDLNKEVFMKDLEECLVNLRDMVGDLNAKGADDRFIMTIFSHTTRNYLIGRAETDHYTWVEKKAFLKGGIEVGYALASNFQTA